MIDNHGDGALAERHRHRASIINNVQSKSVTTVMFIMLTVHLKERSHHGDVNEVNCQFITARASSVQFTSVTAMLMDFN